MSNIEFKFGWLKDSIPDQEKFVHPKYGFTPLNGYQANIETVKRHSLFEMFGNSLEVYNQGNLSSCVSNALLFAFRMRLAAQKYAPHYLSRLFLYYEQRARLNCVNSDSGSTIYSGIDTLKNTGVSGDQFWDYRTEKFRERPSDRAYNDAKCHLIINCSPVKQDLNEIKQHLLNGFPIVFGFMIYSSFMSQETKRTGNVQNPRPGEKCLGGQIGRAHV